MKILVLGTLLSTSTLVASCTPAAPEQAGSRSFERQVALEDSAATSANVSLGDVNGDGHLDIVLVKGRHWPLEDLVLLGDGRGGLSPAYALGGPADRSYSGVLVDLDGDGDLDVVVSNDQPDEKVVHLNDGNGRFTVGSTFGEGDWATRHIRVADLDGDALPDVVLANRYGDDSGPSYICYGVEGGRFAEECLPFASGSSTTIAPADVDHDGWVDLIVPHRDGGQSFVYVNDGAGSFPERRPFGPPDASIRSAEGADLDGDGVTDIVVIDEGTGPAVFRGRPDGTYSEAEPLPGSGATPYALSVADLDQDGRVDVIVGYVESRPVVYFNDGAATFHGVPFGDAEGTAYGFAVGDVDEDGLLDIAMARSDAPNMLYFGAPSDGREVTTGAADTPAAHEFTGLKVRLETADIDATVAFYSGVLGLEVVDRWADGDDAGVIFGLEGVDGRAFLEFGRVASPANGSVTVQLRVSDMDGFLSRVRGRSEVDGPHERPWGSVYAYLTDPNGVRVIVYVGTV